MAFAYRAGRRSLWQYTLDVLVVRSIARLLDTNTTAALARYSAANHWPMDAL